MGIQAQNNIFTIHPFELMQQSSTLKYEYNDKNHYISYGVLLSYFVKSKKPEYVGGKLCPFFRINRYAIRPGYRMNQYVQAKLITGTFTSKVEYLYTNPNNTIDSYWVPRTYYTAGVGVALGIQRISRSGFCVDFSVGTQYNPQFVTRTVAYNGREYTYGHNHSILSNNLPDDWYVFGPGSVFEIRLGLGTTL